MNCLLFRCVCAGGWDPTALQVRSAWCKTHVQCLYPKISGQIVDFPDVPAGGDQPKPTINR